MKTVYGFLLLAYLQSQTISAKPFLESGEVFDSVELNLALRDNQDSLKTASDEKEWSSVRVKRDVPIDLTLMVETVMARLSHSYNDYCHKVHSSLPGVEHLTTARSRCKVFAVKHWKGPDVLCEASLKQLYLRLKLYHTVVVNIVDELPQLSEVGHCSSAYVGTLQYDFSDEHVSTWRAEKLLYCDLTLVSVVDMLENILNKVKSKLDSVPTETYEQQVTDVQSDRHPRNTSRRQLVTSLHFLVKQLHSVKTTLVEVLTA